MMSQHGGKRLCAVRLLLMTLLLPLLVAGLAWVPTLDSDESGSESESDWQLGHGLSEELSDSAEAASEGEAPQLQVEATKRLWIAELTAKADHAEEAADLIDEIQSRTSSSGLESLKAACKAMCPKCICGVILLPRLPSFRPSRATERPKVLKPLAKPMKPRPPTPVKPRPTTPLKPTPSTPVKPKIPIVAPTTAAAHPTKKKPEALKLTLKVTPKSAAAKVPMTPPPPHVLGPSTSKKSKKWLNLVTTLESQLPDFLLDEEGTSYAYKREVDDHDPLSASRSSEIGIE